MSVAMSNVNAYGYTSLGLDGLVEFFHPLASMSRVVFCQVKQRFVAHAEKGKDRSLTQDTYLIGVLEVFVERVAEGPMGGSSGNKEVVRAVRAGKDVCTWRWETG